LNVFCESGIIGGILFLSLWISALWFLYMRLYYYGKSNILLYGIGAVLLIILFHMFVDTPLHIAPISVVAYCILGFVPIPALFARKIHLKSKAAILCLLVLFMSYSGFVVSSSIKQYYGRFHWLQGYEHRAQHRWSLAIQEYQDALKYLPQEGELLFHLGAALAISDSYSRGIYYLQESQKWYNDKNIYLSLGYANLRIRNFKEAEHNARTALSMFPDQLAPHLLLGQIFYEEGHYEQSKKSLLRCIGRKTSIQSDDVNQIGLDAEELWKSYHY